MKYLILLLTILLICQGCYTYNHADKNDNLVLNQNYKIKTRDQTIRAKIAVQNDSAITVIRNNKEIQIKRADIRDVRSKHFSLVKTAGFPIVALIAFVGIYVAVESSD